MGTFFEDNGVMTNKGTYMKELNQYVAQKNSWPGMPPLDLKLAKDRRRVAGMIDSDLSPENLTCDGELPRDMVIRRHKMLITAAQQLNKLDPEAAKAIYELYTGE